MAVESIQSNIYDIQLYPVPATDVLFIDAAITTGNVVILNSIGQMVYQQNVSESQQAIDVSSLSAGTYIVKYTAANQTFTGKCIIH